MNYCTIWDHLCYCWVCCWHPINENHCLRHLLAGYSYFIKDRKYSSGQVCMGASERHPLPTWDRTGRDVLSSKNFFEFCSFSFKNYILVRYKWNCTYGLLTKKQQFDILYHCYKNYYAILWGAMTKETRSLNDNVDKPNQRKNYKKNSWRPLGEQLLPLGAYSYVATCLLVSTPILYHLLRAAARTNRPTVHSRHQTPSFINSKMAPLCPPKKSAELRDRLPKFIQYAWKPFLQTLVFGTCLSELIRVTTARELRQIDRYKHQQKKWLSHRRTMAAWSVAGQRATRSCRRSLSMSLLWCRDFSYVIWRSVGIDERQAAVVSKLDGYDARTWRRLVSASMHWYRAVWSVSPMSTRTVRAEGTV